MKKILKFIAWFVAILLVLLVIVYLTAGIWLRLLVSNFAPQITKTPVVLKEVDISLFKGNLSFKGFKIGNPSGFANPNAFELGEISVKFDPLSLLTSKIIINEIKINGTKIDAELAQSGQMNLMILNNNVQEYLKSDTTRSSENKKVMSQKTQQPSSSKSAIVKDLSITHSVLSFVLMGQKMQLTLPDIHEKNIGERNRKTLAEIISDIFTKLTTTSLSEVSKSGQKVLNSMLDNLAERSKEGSGLVENLKGGMKNLF